MTATTKLYVSVAEVLAGEYALAQSYSDEGTRKCVSEHIENLTGSLADIFKQDNVRFDRERFYLAVLKRTSLRPEKVDLTTWKWGGTVSHGTMRSEDLIPPFMNVLRELDEKRWSEMVLEMPNENFYSSWGDYQNDLQDFVDKLFDILSGYAPEGCYFGAHPGDGSDFGFWESEWV